MASQTVKVQLRGAQQAIDGLRDMAAKGRIGLRQAVNDTARRGYTLAVRGVTESLNLKPSYVRQRITLVPASTNSLTARIRADKRDTLLAHYGAQQVYAGRAKKRRRTGVSVQVKKGGQRKVMAQAFFVTLKGSDATAIAVRDPAGGKFATGNKRFVVLYGPSPFQHFGLELNALSDELQAVFMANAVRQYQRRVADIAARVAAAAEAGAPA